MSLPGKGPGASPSFREEIHLPSMRVTGALAEHKRCEITLQELKAMAKRAVIAVRIFARASGQEECSGSRCSERTLIRVTLRAATRDGFGSRGARTESVSRGVRVLFWDSAAQKGGEEAALTRVCTLL